MGCYIINGGKALQGNIDIQGSKNSAVAVIMASLVVCGSVEISNVPDISDVHNCLKILRSLGCSCYYTDSNTVNINTENAYLGYIPTSLLCEMRASSYLLGAELARFGRCEHACAGGCDFGSRPMDFHFDVLRTLGATEEKVNGKSYFTARGGLKGNEIILPRASVGATVNAIICASRAKGKTVIKNAAREPHICDLACFLNACGANITNYGTDTVTVYGNKHLHGGSFKLRGDMIEAGTYMLTPLICGGNVCLHNAPIHDLECIISILRSIGAGIDIENGVITVSKSMLKPFEITTAPYPDFPTDLHPQFTVLASVCNGTSNITEAVFDSRFAYLSPLRKMGLNCIIEDDKVTVSGNTKFTNLEVFATDLRGGAALILAALSAKGVSKIYNAEYINRGYSNVVEKLRGIGAEIEYQ